MRVFTCGNCRQNVYFENVICENCGMALGFDPQGMTMRTLAPDASGKLVTSARTPGGARTYCANYDHHVCNWLVPPHAGETAADRAGLCVSCALNNTIPDLTIAGNIERWFEIEKAKRRLIYQLLRLKLPLAPDPDSGVPPLAFDIIAGARTGHADGLITINIDEASSARREEVREAFNEPYRTLLGHMRHESGHYYWMVLVNRPGVVDRYRALFGDDRDDYGEALAAYHQNGPKPEWRTTHISAYATAHSWEDWAESWAHYLHTIDTLETAEDYAIEPRIPNKSSSGRPWFSSTDPYKARNATQLMDRWIPIALAMNSMNRSMGHNDFYPFVVSPPVISKLDFIHQLIRPARR